MALPLVLVFGLMPIIPLGPPTLARQARFDLDASNVWSVGEGAEERLFLWRLAPGNRTGEVIALDTRGRKQFSIPVRNDGQQLRSSTDGRWLVISSDAGSLIYDRSGREIGRLPGKTTSAVGDRFVQASCASALSYCTVKVMTATGQVLQELPAGRVIPVDVSTDTYFRYGTLPTVASFTDSSRQAQLLNPADASLRPLGLDTSVHQSDGHLMTYTFGRVTLDGRELPWPADIVSDGARRMESRFWLAGERVFLNVESQGAWVWQQDHWQKLPGQPRRYHVTDQTDGHVWVTADVASRTIDGLDLATGRTWSWPVADFDQEFVPERRPSYRTKAENDDELLGAHLRHGTVAVTYQSRSALPGRHPGTTVQLLDAQTGARRAKTWATPSTATWRVYPMAGQRAAISYWVGDDNYRGMILG